VNCLQIPERVYCDNGIYEPDGVAFCMLLARLWWPNRLSDLYLEFRNQSEYHVS